MTTHAQKQMETSVGEAMNLHLASPFHLHGVGPAYTWKLALSGIQTIEELIDYHDLNELSESSKIPFKVLSMIQLKARSLLNNEITQIAPFWMPRKKPIYLDIETVPKWDKVWLIGLLVDEEFIQLYARDYDDEMRILSEFNEIIRQYRDRFFVTWTGFDTRILRKRIEVHRLPQSYLNMLGDVDLKLKMKRCFIFPTRGYGLKRIGQCLRYPFKNPHLDGLAVPSHYQDHIERGETLSPKVFEYNEDDVSVLPFIESWAIMHQRQIHYCARAKFQTDLSRKDKEVGSPKKRMQE